jgi:Ca2+-transporting ATPase
MCDDSLRTLSLCYKNIKDLDDVDETEDDKGVHNCEKDDFILLCIVGIKDPLRENMKLYIEKCINAGINVRMVTGDNKPTATAIAHECGILNKQSPDFDVNA